MGKQVEIETTRINSLPNSVRIIFVLLSTAGLGVSIFYIFGFRLGDLYLYEIAYYYLFVSLFFTCVFLIIPGNKKAKGIPYYDLFAAFLAFGIGIYFFTNAWAIGQVGWTSPTPINFTLGIIYCVLILEAARRIAGPVFIAICLIIGLYPLFASHMPGLLFGIEFPIFKLVGRVIFGYDGLLGLPVKVIASLIIGFLLFAAFLMASGAGRFFIDLSMALLGRFRGGPAKVAVIASGFFGSLSGSAYSNIVSTGSFTIPAMKRLGYSPQYAAAIEACASTGGLLMPPVMGSIAFIMAAFLGVDYSVIIIVAAIPAILYYWGLLVQVDAYAARVGLKGLPREECPSLKKTLKQGWPFLTVLIFLIWGLVHMKWGVKAPFYASGLMFLLSFCSRETMITPKKLVGTIAKAGEMITQALAVFLPISFILVGLVGTGFAAALSSFLITAGGDNVFLVLIIGVIFCYILGMLGTATPGYIFLAVSMAPAVIEMAGLNELAVHLFIIYYVMLTGITPPVAAGSFLAAAMAGANPMRTAFTSMRLGVVIYFIPFFFIFNPSLVLQGSVIEAIYLFVLCLLGIWFIAAGFEGYLFKFGIVGLWARPLLVITGILIAFPEWKTTLIGVALAVVIISAMFISRKLVIKK